MTLPCACGGCGKRFADLIAFDAHRTGPFTRHARRCLTGKQMQARHFYQQKHGVWTLLLAHPLPGTWEAAGTPQEPRRITQERSSA